MDWLITNRNVGENGFGDDFSDVTYWANSSGQLSAFNKWSKISLDDFRKALTEITANYPDPKTTPTEEQKHLNLFVHGYDTDWVSAVDRYQKINTNLFSGQDSLGECVLFTWPSKGSVFGYLPDRAEARQSADDLADVLSELYDWMAVNERLAAQDQDKACRAKTSVIAHSMGNYVVQNAMNSAWTRKNRPLLMSLIHQLLMVAADVDNDIFDSGEIVKQDQGEGIANLTYRVTALYSGRDSVLGASSGLKHFGKRRLGRSGLDPTTPLPDNIWDIDCSTLIDTNTGGMQVHGAYFDQDGCFPLMRKLLKGIDRSVLVAGGDVPAAYPKTQQSAAGSPANI